MTRRWSLLGDGGTDPSPATRVVRTAIQTILAVLAAIPAAVMLLDLPTDTTAQIVGISGAAVVIVSAVQNGIEAHASKSK